MLTEYIRQGLSRAISKKLFIQSTNQVITLDPNVGRQIMTSVQHTEQGTMLHLNLK